MKEDYTGREKNKKERIGTKKKKEQREQVKIFLIV
jgi:hypothetical protein